jgi:hypothetical protein
LTLYRDGQKLKFFFPPLYSRSLRWGVKKHQKKKTLLRKGLGRALTQPRGRHREETFLYFGGACYIDRGRWHAVAQSGRRRGPFGGDKRSGKLAGTRGDHRVPAPHRKQILRYFTKHFCQHPLLPTQDGPKSAEDIRRDCVYEMYIFLPAAWIARSMGLSLDILVFTKDVETLRAIQFPLPLTTSDHNECGKLLEAAEARVFTQSASPSPRPTYLDSCH